MTVCIFEEEKDNNEKESVDNIEGSGVNKVVPQPIIRAGGTYRRVLLL